MGILRKVGNWLTTKSDHFVRGDAPAYAGYYGTQEAEYSQTDAQHDEDGGSAEKVVTTPFGNGSGEYGGRVPYRSRYDRERDAYEAAQAARSAAQQMQQTVRQQPVQPQIQQTVRQQPMQPQIQQTVRQQPIQPQMQQSVQQPVQPQMQQTVRQPVQPAQYQYNQQSQAYAQPQANVVAFPGMQRGPDGAYYGHVEYIVSIHSRSECQNVIAYMKANASVFLNMEFIASDADRQRCVDLLSGAAYTLGCRLNKISARGIYLISSPTVKVIMDGGAQRMSAAADAQGYPRQRFDGDAYNAYPPQSQETPGSAPATGFSSGSPTTRFQAQGAERNPSASFGSVMAGGSPYSEQKYAAQGQ